MCRYTASHFGGVLYASVLDWEWDASRSVVFTRPRPTSSVAHLTSANASLGRADIEDGDGERPDTGESASGTEVTLLGWSGAPLEWEPLPPPATRGLRVTVPSDALVRLALARAPFECSFGSLVFKMTNVSWSLLNTFFYWNHGHNQIQTFCWGVWSQAKFQNLNVLILLFLYMYVVYIIILLLNIIILYMYTYYIVRSIDNKYHVRIFNKINNFLKLRKFNFKILNFFAKV